MFSDLQDALGNYLLPFLIAVPVAIVLFFIARQRGDEDALVRPRRAAAEPAPAAPAVPAVPAAVLVVDDSAVARSKLQKLFESGGFEVAVARDGVEALEVLGTRRFNVLLTDLEMPNMDGFELIAVVRGSLETEDLPIIAITGHDELQARVHAVQGLYGLFKKPWNDRELLKRVETLSTLRKT